MKVELKSCGSQSVTEAREVAAKLGRNFRAPHHTVSQAGMLGELALSACGVLLLDCVEEFRGSTLLVLKNHLEAMHEDARPVLIMTHAQKDLPQAVLDLVKLGEEQVPGSGA